MWRFNHKRPEGAGGVPSGPLEGRNIEVGKFHVAVRQTLAEGGCALVYLAKCNSTGRSFALKHIVCGTDRDMQETTRKEVAIMTALKGHPNVVSLVAHSLLEGASCLSSNPGGGAGGPPGLGGGGSLKPVEHLLLMELCEKTLVSAMDGRGGLWYEEQSLLLLFRDVCNAVFAMHAQNPPIAHRDLKAENVLLGSDGAWKLCDFGSATTKHGRVERVEDMGVEEDVIRRTTTPAYRAPEMWDLYLKEVLNEKVDIWALGCLLYRLAFFKSCFDGESKLQVLNGRYSIPESSKFSPPVIRLIRDMLAPAPADRPSVLEVWQRVNSLLPPECRKASGPDRAKKTYVPPPSQRPAPGSSEPLHTPPSRASSMPASGAPGSWASPPVASAEAQGAGSGFAAAAWATSQSSSVPAASAPPAAAAAAGAFWAAFGDDATPAPVGKAVLPQTEMQLRVEVYAH